MLVGRKNQEARVELSLPEGCGQMAEPLVLLAP